MLIMFFVISLCFDFVFFKKPASFDHHNRRSIYRSALVIKFSILNVSPIKIHSYFSFKILSEHFFRTFIDFGLVLCLNTHFFSHKYLSFSTRTYIFLNFKVIFSKKTIMKSFCKINL